MKVLCIDSKLRPGEYDGTRLEEGKIYTVIQQLLGYDLNGHSTPCYALAEIPPTRECDNLYDVDRFIPLSSIDERELALSREAELV